MRTYLHEDDEVSISARIEADLRDRIRRIAEKNERSFSAEIRLALRTYAAVFDPEGETDAP